MNATATLTWTAPFHGVQHLFKPGEGSYKTKKHWCTVEAYASFAILSCWFPGCGFYPNQTQHTNAAAARAAGETYLLSV